MMRIREAHPAEPVIVDGEGVEPRDRAVGDPIGVVPLARDRVVVHLRRAGFASARSIDLQRRVEHGIEHRHCIGMLAGHPPGVVQRAERTVRRRLEMFEAAVQPDEILTSEAVLDEPGERIEEGLEVRLADQRAAIAVIVQHRGHRRSVERQGDTVHPHAVGAGMLPGDDGRPRRHAHDGLRMGALVAKALRSERVDDRSARQRTAVATQVCRSAAGRS